MANVNCQAQILLSNGAVVSLSPPVAEGTVTELTTSTTYSVSATSIGQFAEGKSIVGFIQPVSAPNGISYAYINRRGEIAAICPVQNMGQVNSSIVPLLGLASFQLQAGDTLQVMANTATDREFAYCVRTSKNVNAIFAGTPSGAGNTDLTHILSGQGVGTSLVGQTIVQQFATAIGGSLLSTGGVLILDDKGLPIGGCTATSPAQQLIRNSATNMRAIGLNFVGRVTTSS